MYNDILPTTDRLQDYVKINADTEERVWRPYRADAFRILQRYVPDELMEEINEFASTEEPDETDIKYKTLVLIERPLACFIMAIANPEMSIGVGDAGHTVVRTEKFAPADNIKIKAYQDNLFQRGWNAIEDLLIFFEKNATVLNIDIVNSTNLFKNATDFQDNGNANINYSRLTYETLKSTIIATEQQILKKLITPSVFAKLKDPGTELEEELLSLSKQFVAAKVATVSASEKQTERYSYTPSILLPPLADSTEMSWYKEQSNKLRSEIIDLVNDHLKEFNLTERIGILEVGFNNPIRSSFFMG